MEPATRSPREGARNWHYRFGTVGAGVADCLLRNGDVIAKRTGVKPVIRKIADLDIVRDRGVKVPAGVLTTDATEALEQCDVIVELVGGTTLPKRSFWKR